MYGDNPIRPPKITDGMELDVQQVFATLQGEGPYAGWPSVFVRLGGCNLSCRFCDTEFENFKSVAITELVQQVTSCAGNVEKRIRHLVVITGGEPMRQNIVPFCELLLAEGFKIQIETNGTLYLPLPKEVDIICSPKNNGSGYFPIRPDLLSRVNALKFIVSRFHDGYADVGDVGQSQDKPIYVQPMDEYDESKNKANLGLALQLAQERGYRLSLQLHKFLGIE